MTKKKKKTNNNYNNKIKNKSLTLGYVTANKMTLVT